MVPDGPLWPAGAGAEYEGYAHLLPAQAGWEQIADDALDWALAHARTASPA